jgi:hypothetical protein
MAEPRKVRLRAVAIQELHRPPEVPKPTFAFASGVCAAERNPVLKFSRRTSGNACQKELFLAWRAFGPFSMGA